jgi:Zn ribbon nucleic-acid-binding protein
MGSVTPHCPACSSRGTIETFERFGRHAFFCMECEHSWIAVEHDDSVVFRERSVEAQPAYVRSRPPNS